MSEVEGSSAVRPACIVIVNWNGWRDTLACLASLADLRYAQTHVIVVDNGSTDGSAARLRERAPALHVIETGRNLGFAGGSNVGIHAALERGAAYVWLLNNDTIVDPDALGALVDVMERYPSVGIAGSRITYLDRPDTLWSAGGRFVRPWGWAAHRGEREPDRGRFATLADVAFVTGCSLLVRAGAARAVGPLEEGYFLFWEDVDWCVRARRGGWRVVYVPGSLVRHKLGASLPRDDGLRWRYEGRNRLLFCRRLRPGALPLMVFGTLLNAGYLTARGRPQAGRGLLAGLWDGIHGRSGPLPARKA